MCVTLSISELPLALKQVTLSIAILKNEVTLSLPYVPDKTNHRVYEQTIIININNKA